MKFGIGLFSMQSHPEVKAPHSALYSQALALVRLAEECGFHSAWISEHHFLPDGYCPSPLAAAAAIAAVTSSIRIGTAALLLPLHNPLRIAEDAAVVDNISNGRLDLGIALGYRREEYEGLGVPITQRPSRMEEGIEVLLRAWGEGAFSFEGKRFSLKQINLTPKPVQNPIPFKIGASQEPALRRAARLGFPLLIPPGRTRRMVSEILDTYSQEALKVGRDPGDVEHILLRETYVHKDASKARKYAEKHLINMYRYYFTLGVKLSVRGRELTGTDDPLFEHLPEERFIIGDPVQCREEVERYRDELGIRYILCRMVFPGARFDEVSDCIKLFRKEVIAHLAI